jgi:hypothetical protein
MIHGPLLSLPCGTRERNIEDDVVRELDYIIQIDMSLDLARRSVFLSSRAQRVHPGAPATGASEEMKTSTQED